MKFEGVNNLEKPTLSQEVLYQLQNLGISLDEVTGAVLDVGAGDGRFAKELNGVNGAKIISVDIEQLPHDSESFIISNAKNLPFEENSFDRVVSHASIPNVFINMYSPEFSKLSKEKIRKAISKSLGEILRVLKHGSVATLAPVRIAQNYESEKVFAKILQEILQEIKDGGVEVNLKLIKEEENPVNKEKNSQYRLTMVKK